MVEQKSGHIVTMSSAAGISGQLVHMPLNLIRRVDLVDYCASKFAASGITEALNVELNAHGLIFSDSFDSLLSGYGSQQNGIYTTLVCPIYINTGMFDGVKMEFVYEHRKIIAQFALPATARARIRRRQDIWRYSDEHASSVSAAHALPADVHEIVCLSISKLVIAVSCPLMLCSC